MSYIKANAVEWFKLSPGARSILGVVDDTTETGFFANMKKSVAESELVMDGVCGVFYNYNLIDHALIPNDIEYILNNKHKVPVEELHRATGLFPSRVEGLLRMDRKYRDITDREWDLISAQYQLRLDQKLAEQNMIEISADAISAGYHSAHKQVAYTDSARKQLRESPEEQWANQYAEHVEMAH